MFLLLSLLVAGAQAKKVTLFYNVYAQPRRTTRAFAIVDEQLRASAVRRSGRQRRTCGSPR